MAKPSTSKSETKITRIKASDSAPTKAEKTSTKRTPKLHLPKKRAHVADDTTTVRKKGGKNPFVRIGTYFKGAWKELRLVRWPDRKSTWAMTGALLLFTLFFVVVILVLDYAFAQLFKLILGSN